MPETTLQPDGTAGIDTYLSENSPNSNYGTSTSLTIDYAVDGDNSDALIKFDLSDIPKGSTIEEAILTVHVESYISLAMQADLYRILSANGDWTEGGATWNKKDGTNDWAGSAGCETIGTDISHVPLYEMTSAFVDGDNVFNLVVSEFQALIDDGNYGFVIRGQVRNPSVSRGVGLTSSDSGTAADRPELYVRWIEPSNRPYKYTLDIWDPLAQIRDEKGRVIPYEELEPDNWMHLEGLFLPSGQVYDTLLEDPRKVYLAGMRYDEDANNLTLRASRRQFVEKLLRGITGGI
jgi:hypothetical protein